jgi:hypothetical protein
MKRIYIIPITTIVLVVTVMLYLKWRISQRYNEKIVVYAVQMNHQCGDCSPSMKVLSVMDEQFSFLVQTEIWPITRRNNDGKLCEFINRANDISSFNETDTGLLYTLVGSLHRYQSLWTTGGCSDARKFEVDSIRYGNNEWVNF